MGQKSKQLSILINIYKQNKNNSPEVTVPLLCCSVTKSCPILCNPMDCSTPDFPVPYYLPEFAQVYVYWIDDAIQPLILCCPLLLPSIFPSIGSFPMSQLFASSGQNIGTSASVSVLPMSIQGSLTYLSNKLDFVSDCISDYLIWGLTFNKAHGFSKS